MVQVVKDVVTWLKQWFYTKDDLTPLLGAKANKNLTNANQNVVTDASGDITTEPKITDVSDLTDTTNKQFTPKTHSQATSTITNSTAFDNIKSGESTSLTLDTQAKINSAIDSKLAALSSIDVIKVVDSKPTASASTLNKLYIVSENNKVNVYYTKQSGSSYSWQKMDTDILDELSISWSDITGKPSFEATATNIKMNGTQSTGGLDTFARGDHVHPTDTSRAPTSHASTGTGYGVATTSNYGHTKVVQNLTTNDGNGLALGAGQGKALKTTVDGKADKTAAIGTTITLVDKGETNEGCIIFNTIS